MHPQRSFYLAGVAIVAALVVAGCASGPPRSQTGPSADPASGSVTGFAQFTDIPVPERASLDLDRSLVLGAQDSWLGRLVFTTGHGVGTIYDFYAQEMRRFGWSEITSVRAATSVLTFQRGARIATVQVEGRTLHGAIVSVTVSPRGETMPSAGGMPLAPSRPGNIQTAPLR
ncbi:MAG: hypothetical protein EXR02_02245 [Rhodospirillales bacterium]|nr:hypothetical protein [Rhodospirillales bacterium]